MGTTTFSGPIRAGDIANTTGTELGTNVRNVGSVVMVQHVPITQAATATALGTTIVIPRNSHLLTVQMLNTVGWDGAASTLSVGISATATEIAALTAMPVGVASLTPGTDATRAALWDDTGTTDDRIFVKSANTGAGVGTLTVRYIQTHDLP